jgi:hypothetical protein
VLKQQQQQLLLLCSALHPLAAVVQNAIQMLLVRVAVATLLS